MSSTISIRASSLADLYDCAYRWEARQLLKMRKPASLPMILGTAVHAGTAAFDNARMAGAPIKPDEAAGVVVDKLREPGEDVDLSDAPMTMREAETIGLTLHGKYCTQISPRYEFRAVELNLGQLNIEVPSVGVIVQLTGTLDRTRLSRVQGSDAVRIGDVKTGSRAAFKPRGSSSYVADVKGKGLQLGQYQILAEQVLHEPVDTVADVIGLGTSAGAPVAVSSIKAAKQQVLGRDGSPSLIEIAANMLRTGYFPPNPKSQTCGPKYCPRWNSCPYHE